MDTILDDVLASARQRRTAAVNDSAAARPCIVCLLVVFA
jgi:hypothetical protein